MSIITNEPDISKEDFHNLIIFSELLLTKEKDLDDGYQFSLVDNSTTIYISILKNGKIILQPEDSQIFDIAKEKISAINRTSKIPFLKENSLFISHAKNILGRIKKYDMEDEVDRCAIIMLVDSAIEFLLRGRIDRIYIDNNIRNKSKNLKTRIDLLNAIENNGYLIPFKYEIRNIREKIRNDIMHLGTIPAKEVAENCIKILEKILSY